MEKGSKILIYIFIAVVLVAIVANFTNITGKATLTPGASYGPIDENYKNYKECSYITKNDGWDVRVQAKMQYRDRTSGSLKTIEDGCEGNDAVAEYHCVNGYSKKRIVGCPSNTVCTKGICE